jgi:hypothetical protein
LLFPRTNPLASGHARGFDILQRSLRRGVCWNGLILDDQGSIIAQCSMTDVSASGAKLVMGAGINVPDSFVLTLARNAAVRRNCVVVWRAATSIGVCFVAV